jgi:hypothetical protein
MVTEFDRKYWEERLPIEALEALEENTGVSGRVLAINEKVTSSYEADALTEFETGGRQYQYIGECKSNADRKSLIVQVKSQLENLSQPGLLIAPYVTVNLQNIVVRQTCNL